MLRLGNSNILEGSWKTPLRNRERITYSQEYTEQGRNFEKSGRNNLKGNTVFGNMELGMCLLGTCVCARKQSQKNV